MESKNIVNLALAVVLLLCLAPMPYGFYVLVRYVCCIVFAVFAFRCYGEKQMTQAVVFVALAVLFQPFVRLPLGRVMWNVVDVVTAGILIYPMIKNKFNRCPQ